MVHEADSRNQSSATEKKEINPQLDPILGGTNILHSKFSRGVRSFKPSDEIKLLGKKTNNKVLPIRTILHDFFIEPKNRAKNRARFRARSCTI